MTTLAVICEGYGLRVMGLYVATCTLSMLQNAGCPKLITLNRKSIELALLVVDGLHDGVILWLRFRPCLG